MKVLYKITLDGVKKLYQSVDYVQNGERISFNDNEFVMNNQLNHVLIHKKDGYIIFTFDKKLAKHFKDTLSLLQV